MCPASEWGATAAYADAVGCVAGQRLLRRKALAAAAGGPYPRERRRSRSQFASILSLYKRLIALRKASPALVEGDYHPIAAQGDLLVYRREAEGTAIIVVLNLGPDPIAVTTSAIRFDSEILLSTFLDREGRGWKACWIARERGPWW